ncbi:hypothetical protein LTS18_002862, partial [Coniosporium uncinatum]
MVTQFSMMIKEGQIASLREDISSLKASLQVWLHILTLEEFRRASSSQEQNQDVIATRLETLTKDMAVLKESLVHRETVLASGRRPSMSVLEDDMISRNGKECLSTAEVFRDECTSIITPTASTTSRVPVVEMLEDCTARWVAGARWRPADPNRSDDRLPSTPDAPSDDTSSSRLDSGYDSDRFTGFRQMPSREEGYSVDVLTELINQCKNRARKFEKEEDYDKAAEAQVK